jgi:ABC-type dipeptide/oligopeptide/nickel transport system permease subunit
MSQVGHLSAGGSPVATGGAGGSHRGLRQITGDFAHHPLAMAGLVVLALALLDTLVAPVFINPETMPLSLQQFQGPSVSHPLGTDGDGRDALAQLLYGAHTSMLLVGTTFALAAVVAAILFAVVRLLGRTRGQAWARWAGVVLTPVVGVVLLVGASLVLNLKTGSAVAPNLFTYVTDPFTYIWTYLSDRTYIPFFTQLQNALYLRAVLYLAMLAGELVRFVYLLVQRLRSARAPQPRAETEPVTPAWVGIAVPAVAIGLWVAADVLFLDGLFDWFDWHYVLGVLAPVTPTLGGMVFEGDGWGYLAPWLLLAPLIALLVLYASLNLVGFALYGVLRRSPEPEQHAAQRA